MHLPAIGPRPLERNTRLSVLVPVSWDSLIDGDRTHCYTRRVRPRAGSPGGAMRAIWASVTMGVSRGESSTPHAEAV